MAYIITGKVVHGNRIGRGIGFPTINITPPESGVLSDSCEISQTGNTESGTATEERRPESSPMPDGVWAGRVTVGEEVYPAMVNIGRNPTVAENGERRLEAHLFGFNGEIYGETVRVELLEFIRSEQRFPSLEELRKQIAEDKKVVEGYFSTV